jgi:hypothetical protein
LLHSIFSSGDKENIGGSEGKIKRGRATWQKKVNSKKKPCIYCVAWGNLHELLEKQHTALNPRSIRTIMHILHLRRALFVLSNKASMCTFSPIFCSYSLTLSLSLTYTPSIVCAYKCIYMDATYMHIFQFFKSCGNTLHWNSSIWPWKNFYTSTQGTLSSPVSEK